MNGKQLIGEWVTILRPDLDGNTQRIFGLVEWASTDALNFRLAGIGHIGISAKSGTVERYVPTND